MAVGHSDEMGHMEIGSRSFPGESGSVTWRFTESDGGLYGCHIPGHYEGGMVGSIDVGRSQKGVRKRVLCSVLTFSTFKIGNAHKDPPPRRSVLSGGIDGRRQGVLGTSA